MFSKLSFIIYFNIILLQYVIYSKEESFIYSKIQTNFLSQNQSKQLNKLRYRLKNKKNKFRKKINTPIVKLNIENKKTEAINLEKIKFGYDLINTLLLPSVYYSHIFGYLNTFFSSQIKEKKINNFYKENQPALTFFIHCIKALLINFKYENNEIEAIINLIKEKNVDLKNLSNKYIGENIYQIGINSTIANNLDQFIKQNENNEDNDENEKNKLLVKNLMKIKNNKLLKISNNFKRNTFSIEKKDSNFEIRNIDLNEYGNLFYQFLLEDEYYIIAILNSFLMNIFNQNNTISIEKIALNHIKENENKRIINNLFKKGSEEATNIIKKLWIIINKNKSIFLDKIQIQIEAINKFGDITEYFKQKINPIRKKTKFFSKIMKIAATGAIIGGALYASQKLLSRSTIFENGSNLLNNLKEKISTWNQETGILMKAYDLITGQWIKKAIQKPIESGVNSLANAISGNNSQNILLGITATGISIAASSTMNKYVVEPIVSKIGYSLYEFSLYDKIKNVLNEKFINKKIKYEYNIDTRYINNSIKLYTFIQTLPKIESVIILANKGEWFNEKIAEGFHILERLFFNQVSNIKQGIESEKRENIYKQHLRNEIRKEYLKETKALAFD